jgi:hypothetical protein
MNLGIAWTALLIMLCNYVTASANENLDSLNSF